MVIALVLLMLSLYSIAKNPAEYHNESMKAKAAFFATVSGRVQGVGFRYSAYNEARRLGLSGWVRNTAYGEVDVWAEGGEDAAERFLDWLKRGPPYACVERVDVDPKEPAGYKNFEIVA